MANLDQILDYVADNVIVEQGTSGDWTYRKWSNGTAECWCRKSGTANITTAWGGCYYATSFTTYFPTDLFIDSPVVQAFNSSSTSAIPMGGGLLNKDGFGTQLVRGTSSSNASYNIGFHAIGKWK